jgi:phytoene dehydrogenase-like protein
VAESHSEVGGATHAFRRAGFTFESGPSLFSDLSTHPSDNPLAQILHFLGISIKVAQYNSWHVHVPEGSFITTVGTPQFAEQLEELVDSDASSEWRRLVATIVPLSLAATAVPAAAIRSDGGALLTLARFLPRLLRAPAAAGALLQPSSAYFRDALGLRHPFVLRWLDLLCFLLSGSPANGTPAAEIGFMFQSWYGAPGAMLDYPLGGAGALAESLVRSLRDDGGTLLLRAHAESVLVEDGRAAGVRLRGGRVLRARQAVICNASVWDTLALLPQGSLPGRWRAEAEATPHLPSFMHLHIGIDGTGLPARLADGGLEVHHISVEDWARGVDAPQNVVLVSIPSLLDPSLAPTGCHVIHAYTPATEPWAVWEDTPPGSPAYEALKEARAAVLWRAVELAIPDVRSRVRLSMVGTPHTHARFLRRSRGSYGAGPWCKDAPGGGAVPPAGAATPLPGLFMAGDSLFPGAGVPAVAASGLAAAHARE